MLMTVSSADKLVNPPRKMYRTQCLNRDATSQDLQIKHSISISIKEHKKIYLKSVLRKTIQHKLRRTFIRRTYMTSTIHKTVSKSCKE